MAAVFAAVFSSSVALLSTFTTSFNTNYNGLFSAMVVIILPPVILYCVFSKFFIEALSGGAVKG
jgi:raffinose/stachyose/melibiose transport system permease protein